MTHQREPAGPWIPTAQVLPQMFAAMGVTRDKHVPDGPADTINLPGVNQLIMDPFKSPNANEYSLGFGGALGSNFVYRVDGIYRKYTDFYASSAT